MKTLKDKEEMNYAPTYPDGTLQKSIVYTEDLKQAIKDLKKEITNLLDIEEDIGGLKSRSIIDKIFGVWEEGEQK